MMERARFPSAPPTRLGCVWSRSFGRSVLVGVAMLYALAAGPARAQTDEIEAQRARVHELYFGGQLDEALSQAGMLLDASRAALGEEDPVVAGDLSLLSRIHRDRKSFAQAESLERQALAIRERRFGANSTEAAGSLTELGYLFKDQQRYAEAEAAFKQAIAIRESALGSTSRELSFPLTGLAALYSEQGRDEESKAAYARAAEIDNKGLEEMLQHFDAADREPIGRKMARSAFEAGMYLTAYQLYRDEANAFAGWRLQSVEGPEGYERAREKMLADREVYARAVEAGWYYMATLTRPDDEPERLKVIEETFKFAQYAELTSASLAVSKVAARIASADAALAELVRRRQELDQRYRELSDVHMAAVIAGEKRDRLREAYAPIEALSQEIALLDDKLKTEFPDYADIAAPRALTAAQALDQLLWDEALVQFMFVGSEAYAWALAGNEIKWVRLPIDAETAARKVAALRCGLDHTLWRSATSRKRCEELLGKVPSGGELPFDLAIAHELFEAVLGPIFDFVGSKQLLVVPAGVLGTLPLNVLLTEKPRAWWVLGTTYANADWLGRRNPITILPSVSGLATLRQSGRGGMAPEPYAGFGDPVLVGTERCAKLQVPERCPGEGGTQIAAAETERRSSAHDPDQEPVLVRGGLADVTALRTLCPLPDTAFELGCVVSSVGGTIDRVYLGAAATETAVKSAPLDNYGILHFATHGLLPRQTKGLAEGLAEPALVLTPPETATVEDDGLLTASEISRLKLDADWVVLSACNTAGGASGDPEALSGLARAFLFAGARTLLVSHWEVASPAAVRLTTGAFAALQAKPGLGRAEALRRAMVAILNTGSTREVHPSYWAPFVVVGAPGR